jgi:transcriptional regulator with XRE-family HTH domain
MQDERVELCSIAQRLESLRVATQERWAEIAERIGLSESMLYQVKSGKRQMSSKALARLAQVEREIGLAAPLAEQLTTTTEQEKRNQLIEGASLVELAQLIGDRGPSLIMKAKLEGLGFLSEQFFENAGILADFAIKAASDTTDKELSKELAYFAGVTKRDGPKLEEWVNVLIRQVREIIIEPSLEEKSPE